MRRNRSIHIAIAKQICKLIRVAYKSLKRGIWKSNLLVKRPQNDGLQEYEFSCSSSPAVKKWRHRGRYCYRVEDRDVAAAVQRVFDMLNREVESAPGTPMSLPGFGGTPVRQLRVTDSPFPEAKGCEEEEAQVSKAADEFIRRFYGDLRREKTADSSFNSPTTSRLVWG